MTTDGTTSTTPIKDPPIISNNITRRSQRISNITSKSSSTQDNESKENRVTNSLAKSKKKSGSNSKATTTFRDTNVIGVLEKSTEKLQTPQLEARGDEKETTNINRQECQDIIEGSCMPGQLQDGSLGNLKSKTRPGEIVNDSQTNESPVPQASVSKRTEGNVDHLSSRNARINNESLQGTAPASIVEQDDKKQTGGTNIESQDIDSSENVETSNLNREKNDDLVEEVDAPHQPTNGMHKHSGKSGTYMLSFYTVYYFLIIFICEQ